MKTFTGVFASAAFLTSFLFAQPPMRGDMPGPVDPAKAAERRVERLTRQLGLSADQAAKALTIFTNSLTAIQPLQTSMRQARQAAAAAVKTNETATIEHQATSIGLVTGQIAAVELKAEAAFYQILTAEQKAKMDQGGGRMGMGPGMMPPRGR